MTENRSGFTVLELIVGIVLVIVAGSVFFYEKKGIEAAQRDTTRKTALNAMYYSLEEVFYRQNHYYPASISATNLPSVDPRLFEDPFGRTIGQPASDYRYEPTGCNGGQTCSGYRLRADLEKESDFVLNSRNH